MECFLRALAPFLGLELTLWISQVSMFFFKVTFKKKVKTSTKTSWECLLESSGLKLIHFVDLIQLQQDILKKGNRKEL